MYENVVLDEPYPTRRANETSRGPNPPSASIVVCTRNNAEMLEETLASILADSSSLSRELIVVDNGSSDPTPQVVAAAAAGVSLPVRYEYEHTPGASHARNRGVLKAAAPLVLFADDDVLVADGWADALAEPFSDSTTVAVAGRIIPLWPVEPPVWMNGPHSTRLTLEDHGSSPRLLDLETLPYTANLAVRRDVLLSFDPPFDPRLGPAGRLKLDGEDWHLARNLLSVGMIRYSPEAVISHRVRVERMDYAYMRRAFFQVGMGSTRGERLRGADMGPPFRRLIWTAKAYYGAWRVRRRNTRLSVVGPEEAGVEFAWYSSAGGNTEKLLHKYPRAAEWVAARVV